MDSSSQYMSSPSYLQSPQLPSPSDLGLMYPSRANAMSPSLPIPSGSQRPAQSYTHPSLSNVSSPPIQTWSGRTSSSPAEPRSPLARHQEIRPKPEPGDANGASLQQQQSASFKREGDDSSMPATSDFVKKLYRMLEDGTFSDIVCWGPQGDCFVIKDLNEFTKAILPRMFKHSNFASFVRQLNKYDFHKVKNTDDNEAGEHVWMFRHPEFHVDGRDALEHIKRKVPGNRKTCQRSGSSPSPTSAPLEALQVQLGRMARQQDEMTAHIRHLETEYDSVLGEMVNFQRNLTQQDGLMQNLVQYFLQVENAKINLQERGQDSQQTRDDVVPNVNPFLQVGEAQQMMGGLSYPEMDIARASLSQMSEISRRAETAGMTFNPNAMPSSRPSTSLDTMPSAQARTSQPTMSGSPVLQPRIEPADPLSRQDALARIAERLSRTSSAQGIRRPAVSVGPSRPPTSLEQPASGSACDGGLGANGAIETQNRDWSTQINTKALSHEGLQVYTVGHLMPRSTVDDANGNWSFDPAAVNRTAAAALDSDVVMPTPQGRGGDPQQEDEKQRMQPIIARSASQSGTSTPSGGGQTLRVRRSTYVPMWAVPPKVLLVDDDLISRKLGSKLLQVFGCTIDVAVDGVGAVNKMNLEKYDLVLMDIVMPKLDGVSATSLIRQFDPMTPIISMTGNAKPNEVIKYYSSGMNDVLPKPFSKDGLLEMLEKHLTHLKVIKTMANLPRSLGIPPMSDGSVMQTLTAQAVKQAKSSSRGNGRINPLAGMSLSDEQYSTILQNLVNGEAFEDVDLPQSSTKRGPEDSSDDRYSKRSRFVEIE